MNYLFMKNDLVNFGRGLLKVMLRARSMFVNHRVEYACLGDSIPINALYS
jgi:hypothetical protein